MTDERDENDRGIPRLTERDLVPFSATDSGWVMARPQLRETAFKELENLLTARMPAGKVRAALWDISVGFSDAVEAGLVERRAAIDAEASPEAKKPSSKSGVRLRSRIDEFLVDVEKGERTPEDICSSIAADDELGQFVNMHIEERIRPFIADPLERDPRASAEYLPEVLAELRSAIDFGVTTGTVEAAHDIIAKTIFRALLRATGHAPKRNWDHSKGDDAGFGLECCRILAKELNDLLPVDLKRKEPVDMAKAWRRAIEENATFN